MIETAEDEAEIEVAETEARKETEAETIKILDRIETDIEATELKDTTLLIPPLTPLLTLIDQVIRANLLLLPPTDQALQMQLLTTQLPYLLILMLLPRLRLSLNINLLNPLLRMDLRLTLTTARTSLKVVSREKETLF